MEETEKRSTLARITEWAGGLLLFVATAAVVWWQNSRLTVLYDLCGVLENAARIAQGDLPYKDFPFPYAPLTFLTQAAVIKLTGAVYWHHIVYCCVIAGLATVILWRILANLFREALPHPGLIAFLLSLPVTILGIYCVFPHPFYDPDATFVILVCILWALRLEQKEFPPLRTFFLGVLCVAPLFIKQNIGLAFLAGIGLCLFGALIFSGWTKLAVKPYLVLSGGIAAGLLIATGIIHFTVGLEIYKQWTWDFATARRSPSAVDMLSVYADQMLILWVGLVLSGAYLLRRNVDETSWRTILGVLLVAVPFVWPVVYLMLDADASERAERLVGLWPLGFIASFALAYLFSRRLRGIALALPFILIATSHGVFLSQQLWGSTYGIWPLLMILIALILILLFDRDNKSSAAGVVTLASVISVAMIVAGSFYIYSNERLDYVSFDDGEMAHSTLPQLQGLSMRGSYIPDFEELVVYTDREVPREDGLLFLPGEDLFYYTTGRHPHFPVLLFDVTNNPYNADEIREKVLSTDIDWIILKNDLQIEADQTINDKDRIFDVLKPYFRHIESLNNYEIYKRRRPDDPHDDEEDDDSDDSSESSEN
jgi:hypothetical protein